MRYIVMTREKLSDSIKDLREVNAIEFEQAQKHAELYNKEPDISYYTECLKVEFGSFESKLIDYALEQKKALAETINGIKRIIEGVK